MTDNPIVNAQVADFAKAFSVTEWSESDQFELYSIHCICNGALAEQLDPTDVHLHDDTFGIDGACLLIQGELFQDSSDVSDFLEHTKRAQVDFVFIQSKSSARFDYGDISKFLDAVEEFFSKKPAQTGSLKDLATAKDSVFSHASALQENPTLQCFYVTAGSYEAPDRIEKLLADRTQRLEARNLFSNIRIAMVGAKDLQAYYRASTSANSATITFDKNVVLPRSEKVTEAYLGFIPAKEIVELVATKDDAGQVIGINKAVFYDNIRDYDPDSEINAAISKSIEKTDGSSFVFRNNGITVVAKHLDRTGDSFKVDDYQIVNGCQTSHVLFESSDKLTDKMYVPFRLIASEDDDFISSIIVGTNSQNPVKQEQFWALKPFLKDFETYCRSQSDDRVLYYERRENQYRGQAVERTRIVTPSLLLKSIVAMFVYQPHRAGRDYRRVRDEYGDTLFLDTHDVRIYHAACFANYRLEFLWRNQRIDNSSRLYRFYILYALGREFAKGRDIFRIHRREIEEITENICVMLEDEKKAVRFVSRISSKIEAVLSAFGRSRERDFLRTEEALKEIALKIAATRRPGSR